MATIKLDKIGEGTMLYARLRLLVGLSLLAFSLAVPAQNSTDLRPPPPDKARIVFVRVKQGFGQDVGANLFETTSGKLEFVGRLVQEELLVIETSPGKKEFMTLGTSKAATGGLFTGDASLMAADVLGGKTYYAVLHFSSRASSFFPIPLRADSRYFKKDSRVVQKAKSTYKLVVEDRHKVFTDLDSSYIQQKYDRAKRELAAENEARMVERALRPEDGE